MNIEKAILIATTAHEGQVDKGGHPYILHPLRVMLRMKTDILKIIAVLHDVIEDTSVTLEDLLKEGFSIEIVSAIDALTRREGETYKQFILRIKENSLATEVKIEDIKENMDLSRIPNPTEQDFSRLKRYEQAIQVLTD